MTEEERRKIYIMNLNNQILLSRRNRPVTVNTVDGGSPGESFDSDITIVGITIGQSNAGARGEKNRLEALTSYISAPTGVKIYYKPVSVSDVSWGDDGAIQAYEVGVNSVEPVSESTIDCHNEIVSLGPAIQSRINRDVYFINAAYGGTSLGSSALQDWAPGTVGERFFVATSHYIDRLTSEILLSGKKPKFFISWHQGESDADDAGLRAAYGANFAAFVTALRATSPYLQESICPLFITKLYYNVGANETIINNALDGYVAANPTSSYIFDVASQVTYPRKQDLPLGIRTTYPPTASDDAHNSYEFQVKKGELIAAKLDEIEFYSNFSIVENYTQYELNRVLERCTAASITHPSGTNLTKINTLIEEIKAIDSGVTWKKVHGLYLAANDSGGDFTRVNIKHPRWPLASLVGSPTHTSNVGFAWNGTSQYINLGFLFSSNIGLGYADNMSMGQLVHAITSKISFGTLGSGGANDFYMHNTPASSSVRCLASAAVAPITGYTTGTKFFAISRYLNTEYDFYTDGTRYNQVVTRTGTTAVNPKFGYNNLVYGDETFSAGFAGYGLTQTQVLGIRTALINYKASL